MVTTTSLKNDPQAEVWKLILGTDAARAKAKSPLKSGFQEVLPGLDSGDPRFHAFQRDLAEALDDQIDHVPINRFAPKSGVASSFNRIRSVSGYMSSPTGRVLIDNSRLRAEELKRSRTAPTQFELDLLHELIDAMFEYADYRDLKVASKSSQGLPSMSYDKDKKIADAMRLFQKDNLEDFLRATERRDGVHILNKHKTCYVYMQGYRTQADTFGKVRKVPDLAYALSGGESGELLMADKTVIGRDGVPVSDVQACRSRQVMGMANAINLLISSFRSGTMNYCLKEYEYTWKHTSRFQKAEKLNAYLKEYPNGTLIGKDVGKFDASVPRWLRVELYEYISGRYVSEQLGKVFMQGAFAPVLQPETGDGLGAILIGDALNMESLPSPGLLSGWDMVSPEGKLFNVWQDLVLISLMMGEDYIRGNVRSFLKGKLSIRELNMGDDGILMFPEKHLGEKFFSDEVMDQSFLLIEPEAALEFGGDVFVQDPETGFVTGYNKCDSFWVQTLVAEKSWRHPLRQFWNVGLGERPKVYENNPSFHKSLDIADPIFARRFRDKGDWRTFQERLIRDNRYNVPELVMEADQMFMMDPNVIHYKITADDVSKHLLDAVYSSIPLSAYEHMIGVHLLSRQI